MRLRSMYCLKLAAASIVMFSASALLHASETDNKITSSFENSYVSKTYLKDDDVNITSKNGTVTLTGKVADEYNKSLAYDTASSIPGVVSVNNQLISKAGDTSEEYSDFWIARKVNLNLLFNRHVSYVDTEIDVKDGIVTLRGESPSMAIKELTTEYTKEIDGVKSVRNEMTVAANPQKDTRTAGEKIDDASVTAQVKTALTSRRPGNNNNTKVETRDGKVTLTGIAANAAEKTLITRLVADLRGVDSVNNMMTIKAN